MRLVRVLYPYLFILVVSICDYTLDAFIGHQNLAALNSIEDRQEKLLVRMKEIENAKFPKDKEQVARVYEELKFFIKGDLLDTFVALQKELEYEQSGYTVQSIARNLMSLLFFGGLFYRIFLS